MGSRYKICAVHDKDNKLEAVSTSKKITLPCRLETPFLGSLHGRDHIMRFDTVKINDDMYIKVNTAQWRWAMKEALDSMGILAETGIDYVRLPIKLKAPSIRYYSLRGSSKEGGRNTVHECFQAGTVLTIPVFVLSVLEGSDGMAGLFNQRPPTEKEVVECFSIIGECIGLSPWGSKSGFGRFSVEDMA